MSKPTAFPLDESRLPFEIPRDEPYREKIARLGQMITDRIPAKKGILTKDAPEHWGLASIVTDEMADVALKMKVRKPMTLPELVKATGKPAGELEPLLQQMAVVGLLPDDWPQPPRLPRAGQVESGAGRVWPRTAPVRRAGCGHWRAPFLPRRTPDADRGSGQNRDSALSGLRCQRCGPEQVHWLRRLHDKVRV